ncbi:MAG: 2'-5' RNA ligase family protein [Candidatus Ornithomonoglobus sp.]
MKERTIMIFPKFDNTEKIDEIRSKYDPLSDLVRPHITLVFPFKSETSTERLSEQIKNAVKGISPFEIKLTGFSTEQSKFGNYLFLNVKNGAEHLKKLNQNLYGDKQRFTYNPH